MTHCGTLHILTGKIASGKSTFALQLSQNPATVLISEDKWLSTLYGPEMKHIDHYVTFSARLREGLLPHVADLLNEGVSVVLDFAANTPAQRHWCQQIIESSGCAHVLHYLDVPDDLCRTRLHARNASGDHPFQVSDEQFDWITERFVPPQDEEDFNIEMYLSEK